jgi:hypothetical protein
MADDVLILLAEGEMVLAIANIFSFYLINSSTQFSSFAESFTNYDHSQSAYDK